MYGKGMDGAACRCSAVVDVAARLGGHDRVSALMGGEAGRQTVSQTGRGGYEGDCLSSQYRSRSMAGWPLTHLSPHLDTTVRILNSTRRTNGIQPTTTKRPKPIDPRDLIAPSAPCTSITSGSGWV